jgi:virginiamycin B lyase
MPAKGANMKEDNISRIWSGAVAVCALRIGALIVVVTMALAGIPRDTYAIETGVFTGSVHQADGNPVAGAMVTFTNRAIHRDITVFASADGRFRFPQLEVGSYDLRVRRAGYQDLRQSPIELGDGTKRLDLKMAAETDPHKLAWQLPASRWLPLVLVRLSNDSAREQFTRQCAYCHQQGSWATRVPRGRAEWETIFDRMATMGGNISPQLRAELPDALNSGFDEKSYLAALTKPRFVAPPIAEGAAATSVITEWDLGTPTSALHDIAVAPDGSIWAVDTGGDRLWRLDPRTAERREIRIPTGDSKVGGVFHGTGFLQSPGMEAKVAPHSLQFAPDGTLWVTLCLGNKVGHFDPHTGQWHIYVQKDGLYPHTLRIDRNGRVWYTLAVSNGVGMINPATGEQRVFHLPFPAKDSAAARDGKRARATDADHPAAAGAPRGEGTAGPVPYGIDIAPDGGVWFSQLNARRIGRIDPKSGEIKIVDTPFDGPRRLRFDSRGNLWIPGFSSGVLARYTPSSGAFRIFKLPIRGMETPYALNVDRRTDTVWICGTASDTLMSFDPRTEKFTVYPMPMRVTYTREIDFDKHGAIWTSNSSFPAWHTEASNPRVIRVEPGAAPKPE